MLRGCPTGSSKASGDLTENPSRATVSTEPYRSTKKGAGENVHQVVELIQPKDFFVNLQCCVVISRGDTGEGDELKSVLITFICLVGMLLQFLLLENLARI